MTILSKPATAPHPWSGRRIPDMLADAVSKWPTHAAVVEDGVSTTYAELGDMVRRTATVLHGLGVEEGDHVAILLPETLNSIVTHHAVAQVGAVVVPLNIWWESEEVLDALKQCGAQHVIAGGEVRGTHLSERLRTVMERRGALPKLRTIISDSSNLHVDATLEDLFDPAEFGEDAGGFGSENDAAYLIFTSGSTARPKATLLGHSAMLGTSFHVADRYGIQAGDQYVNVLPFFHSGGLVVCLYAAQQRGATIHLYKFFNPERMVEPMADGAPVITGGFDVVTMRLIEEAKRSLGTVPIRCMISSPGVATFDAITELGIDHIMIYALTEGTCLVSITTADDTVDARRNSNGYPLPGVDVQVRDPDSKEPLAHSEWGEIGFRGWNLMYGYLQEGGEVQLPVDGDGYYWTGDNGLVDELGRVFYRGRYSAMIKTGGENVSEAEVEMFLTGEIEGVAQAAVVGVPDERWGELVVAFVQAERTLDTEKIRSESRGRIAPYKMPRLVFQVGEHDWPTTGSGKLDKSVLRELATARHAQSSRQE